MSLANSCWLARLSWKQFLLSAPLFPFSNDKLPVAEIFRLSISTAVDSWSVLASRVQLFSPSKILFKKKLTHQKTKQQKKILKFPQEGRKVFLRLGLDRCASERFFLSSANVCATATSEVTSSLAVNRSIRDTKTKKKSQVHRASCWPPQFAVQKKVFAQKARSRSRN